MLVCSSYGGGGGGGDTKLVGFTFTVSTLKWVSTEEE